MSTEVRRAQKQMFPLSSEDVDRITNSGALLCCLVRPNLVLGKSGHAARCRRLADALSNFFPDMNSKNEREVSS